MREKEERVGWGREGLNDAAALIQHRPAVSQFHLLCLNVCRLNYFSLLLASRPPTDHWCLNLRIVLPKPQFNNARKGHPDCAYSCATHLKMSLPLGAVVHGEVLAPELVALVHHLTLGVRIDGQGGRVDALQDMNNEHWCSSCGQCSALHFT